MMPSALLREPRVNRSVEMSSTRSSARTRVRVYLLGAGCSRAISSKMPTLWELSDIIRGELNDQNIPGADKPVAVNFEQWLSYLVERPPWLSPADQEQNQAGFLRVASAVHRVLSERQAEAVDSQ